MTKPVILWFRQDLRLADNPALNAAVKTGAPVIPVYIRDEQMGAASKWWLHHSLAVLAGKLKGLEATLVLRVGDAQGVLADIMRDTGAEAVYWNRQYEPSAIARDNIIKDKLNGHSFKAAVLFEPWEVETKTGTPFRVFTPYYKACLNLEHLIGAPVRAPAAINGYQGAIKSDDLNLLPTRQWADGFRDMWEPGEDGALIRAQEFLDHKMAGYATERDRPDRDGTSGLSPHLHFGEISVRALWHAAKPLPQHAAFLREIVWREFSTHLLYHNPRLATEALQPRFRHFPWQVNADYLKAWQTGMTGYPIVDAGMRQLWQTGWMHNRVRMVVGSFLVKHLLQPWADGEAWFWNTLVDADLANNAASWQWIAGCGADAAPYFRVFNPILQGEKFDPKGDYVRHFCPELAAVPDKFIHKPWESGMTLDYPAPIIDHAAGRARALDAFAAMKGTAP